MSPRKRRSGVLDADALEALSIDDVEAAAAEAEARARTARARAEELRRQAGEEPSAQSETAGNRRAWSRPGWLRFPGGKPIAVAAAVVLICMSLAATGYMMWQHHLAAQERQRAAEFSAAARQSVVTMMSLNPATVRQDMQRVVENSTGRFKKALDAGGADEIVKRVEQSKVNTKVTVQSVAIENMSGDSAVALVSALSEGTGPDNQKLPLAPWRISVSLNNDNGQLKTSEFEFVQ